MKSRSKKHKKKLSRKRTVNGVFQRTRRGFGFVLMDGGDIFVSARNSGDAMDGDIVEAVIKNGRYKKNEKVSYDAKIIKITKRAHKEIVGRVRREHSGIYIIPIDQAGNEVIAMDGDCGKDLQSGDIILADIYKYPHRGSIARCRLIDVIGLKGEPKADIDALIALKKVRTAFSEEAINSAKTVYKNASDSAGRLILPKTGDSRRNLRNLKTVTIDGADSKDFDDAVSLVNEKECWRLFVSIADVAEYIKFGGILDGEAFERGNSIYLPDRVIPMLPEDISNGICSLNPNEDRLTLTCEMLIDKKANVVNYDIYESIIRSNERLVYDDVSNLLEKEDPVLKERFSDIEEMLIGMRDLALDLQSRRMKEGSIDFDLPEGEIKVDGDGNPVWIGVRERRIANEIIEEFMLLANRVVAEHYFLKKSPFVYRVHEKPDGEKTAALREFLEGIGIRSLPRNKAVTSIMLSEVLRNIKGTSLEYVAGKAILRSMQKAEYKAECLGHYGLAFRYYCHFTSPIRRYSDLTVHRIIKASIHWRDNEIAKYADKVAEVASHCSETERIEQELERGVEKLMKVRYMAGRIGEEADGIISGIVPSGIFVELPNTIEGFVRFDSMNGYYIVDEKKYRAVEEDSGKSLIIGDEVRIKVVDVSEEDRTIDFHLMQRS